MFLNPGLGFGSLTKQNTSLCERRCLTLKSNKRYVVAGRRRQKCEQRGREEFGVYSEEQPARIYFSKSRLII